MRLQEKDGSGKVRRLRRGPRWRLCLPEILILLLSLTAFVALVPLRTILAPIPALLFLAAFALFMIPGLVLALSLLRSHLPGPARIPVAFVLSAGIFGLVALPVLLLGRTITFYPLICGGILVMSLGLTVVRLVRKRIPAEDEKRSETDLSTVLLWAPFSLLIGALGWASAVHVPRPPEDAWLYLAYIREFFELEELNAANFSRLAVNGWLPEQAGLSLISGLDPVTLVLRYLAPALVVMALLALYALASILLQNEKAALVISSLSALFFVANFGSPSFNSALAPTGEFVERITEDKYVVCYVFLPVALSLAILFLRERSWRNLGLFFFVCLSTAVIHPLGLVFIGASVAGFGLVHLAIERGKREAWLGIGGLWIVLLVLTGPPALYLLATGSRLLSKLDSTNPEVAANLIDNLQYERRLLEIGEGSYIAHPSFFLDPGVLMVYLLGVPFLIWKIKQANNRLAAQLLLGTLVFVPILTFVPYIATLISGIIGPWLLRRLMWPLLLASLLTLGWMCWEVLRLVGSGLSRFQLSSWRLAPFLPLIIIVCLLISVIPLALTSIRAADASDESPQAESTCADPVFSWMQSTIPASSKVMAPRLESSCIAAYSTPARTLGIRGGLRAKDPQDQETFYGSSTLGQDALQILQLRKVNYVVLSLNSPLNVQLEHLAGFTRTDNPGDKYHVYAVEESALEPAAPVLIANGNFNEEEWDAAIDAYTEALEGDRDERFLAHLGLGRAYAEKEFYAEAIENYEAAIEIDPKSPAAHDFLAKAYNEVGEKPQARNEFEKAVELDPRNVDLRLRYGQFLTLVDLRAAIEQYRVVVEAFPKVPEYRAKLAAALLLTAEPEAADKEFERAVYLAPLSAKLQADIGRANLLARRPAEALRYYERALQLEPNNQLYTLELGKVHALLSVRNGPDEEHFEDAEALLKRVEELDRRRGEEDQREKAQLALGDLYRAWNRPVDAAAAYEEALELDSNSKEAREGLAGLR